MKNVLFFVHGIGRHAKGWASEPDGPIDALQKAMSLYPSLRDTGKLSDHLKLVEIRYDGIFDQVLNQWQQLAESLGPAGGQIKWVSKVQDLLSKVGNNQSVYADFGGDILLYFGFDLIARAVRLRINSVIASEIFRGHMDAQNAAVAPPSFALIAHSMGTAVAQDALVQLATANWLQDKDALIAKLPDHPELAENPALSATQRADATVAESGTRTLRDRPIPVRLSMMMQVSNTTRLLKRVDQEYATLKAPGGGFDAQMFVNVNNEFDPVSIGGGYQMPARRGGIDVKIRHIHQKNVHGFAHYLSHPSVHSKIFHRLIETFTDNDLQEAERLAALPEWQGVGGDLGGMLESAKADLKATLKGIVKGDTDIDALREIFERYKTELDL